MTHLPSQYRSAPGTPARRAAVAHVLFIIGIAPAGVAALEPPPATQPAATPADRLIERQEIVLNRLTRLEDRMFQLSRLLSRTEPEQAARLLDALNLERESLIRQRIEGIIEDIRHQRLSDATDSQTRVMADLQLLLRLLTEEPGKPEVLDEQIRDLEQLREQLQRIVEEQESELRDARDTQASTDAAVSLARALAQLRDLARQQADLSAATRNASADAPDALKQLAQKQADLREKTSDRARELKQLAGEDDEAPSSPSDAPFGGATAGAQAALEQAAGEMNTAQAKLDAADPAAAQPPQARAEKQLERALRELENQQQRLDRQADQARQAQAQRETASRTADLAQRMKGQPSGDSRSGGGDGSGSPSGDDKPGWQQVAEAVPNQQDAARKLDERQPDPAAESQEKALEKLKQARKALDDALEQLRREQQEERLASLEARFSAMLARQLEINKKTNRLDTVGAPNWSRADQLELAETTTAQNAIGDDAAAAVKILEEDGTTIVFPHIVQQIEADARDAAGRLERADTGSTTRQIQEGIVEALQELLAAIEELQSQSESGEGNEAPPGPEATPPLLPGSAELKLLRSCQVRVNRMTEEIEQQRVLPDLPITGLRERLESLARRQSDVARMAREMVEGERARP